MKAMLLQQYGSHEYLEPCEIQKPVCSDKNVIVKIKACSINSWDNEIIKASLFVNRLMFGLFKPKRKVLGCDIAGVVEEVGSKVKHIKPGDEVMADISPYGWGGFGEYVCVPDKALSIKPSAMSFEQASAFPQAGVLALQGLTGIAQMKEGDKLLLIGAGGGVGTFALQLAKLKGVEVTCIDTEDKFETLWLLGADHCVDFRKDNFSLSDIKYNRIIDVKGSRKYCDYKNALAPDGICLLVGGSVRLLFEVLFRGLVTSLVSSKKIRLLIHKPNMHLSYLNELFEKGELRPVIGKLFSLDDLKQAFEYYRHNKFVGKIVVKI